MKQPTEAPRMIAVAPDVELAVWRSGQGPVPIILLNGYSLTAETWSRVLPLFPPDEFTVFRYDMRGCGVSSKPADGYTMTQQALDLRALILALELPAAVLIGHSLGGAISQEFATLHPQHVLAYISSNALARHQPLPGMDDAKRQRMEALKDPEGRVTVLGSAVRNYVDPRHRTDETLQILLAMAMQASSTALREQLFDAYCAPALEPALFAALKLPVLAMTGSTDPVAPPAQAIALAEIVPDSELVITPRAGHSPMLERPEEWMRAVLDFLRRRVGQRSGS